MTNSVPKFRYLINLLLTPGMDFKSINLEYDTHAFITKENIEETFYNYIIIQDEDWDDEKYERYY